LVVGTEKMQPTELGAGVECMGALETLQTSLLLQKPRLPVDDTELRSDCLHNYHWTKPLSRQFLVFGVPRL
jgi:hypothetical protein